MIGVTGFGTATTGTTASTIQHIHPDGLLGAIPGVIRVLSDRIEFIPDGTSVAQVLTDADLANLSLQGAAASAPVLGPNAQTFFGQGDTVIPAGAKKVVIQHRQNTALVPGDFVTDATVNGVAIDSGQELVFVADMGADGTINNLPQYTIVSNGDAIWWYYITE